MCPAQGCLGPAVGDVSAGASFHRSIHPSACWESFCLPGVYSSLTSVGSTSQGVGQSLFRPLDHTGVELGVAAGVLGEVVAPHEALLTQGAAELLLPSVGPVVAGQFV